MKVSKLILKAYYNSNGELISWPYNPLHNKSFENVEVKVKRMTRTICGIKFSLDVIEIAGQDPIECELISRDKRGNDLTLHLCQDWG